MRASVHRFVVSESEVMRYFAQFLLDFGWSFAVVIIRIPQLLSFIRVSFVGKLL